MTSIFLLCSDVRAGKSIQEGSFVLTTPSHEPFLEVFPSRNTPTLGVSSRPMEHLERPEPPPRRVGPLNLLAMRPQFQNGGRSSCWRMRRVKRCSRGLLSEKWIRNQSALLRVPFISVIPPLSFILSSFRPLFFVLFPFPFPLFPSSLPSFLASTSPSSPSPLSQTGIYGFSCLASLVSGGYS